MKPKPALIVPAPTTHATTLDTALEELRQLVKQDVSTRLRLQRLGQLLAGGRALKLVGAAVHTQALQKALEGYAGRAPFLQTLLDLQQLHPLPELGLHVTWCRGDGWPLCEYHLAPAPDRAEPTLLVTGQDGLTRVLSVKAFQGLFGSSLHGLRCKALRPVALSQAA